MGAVKIGRRLILVLLLALTPVVAVYTYWSVRWSGQNYIADLKRETRATMRGIAPILSGYVQQKDAHMVKPTDKIFMLTKNAAVRADANKWSKKLSEVHRGHNVHVIGIALNYVKIRMKSGLEGYIPLTALE